MSAGDQTRHFPLGEDLRTGRRQTPLKSRTADPAVSYTLIQISHRLRPRDYAIASLLHLHTVLTTAQLADLLFTNPTTCRHRLNILRSFGFVDRFVRRHRLGAPDTVCWIAGPLSARLAALAAGEYAPTARALRERQDRIYANPALDHLLDTNGFFVNLLAHERAHGDTSLLRWWSERATAAAFGQRIHPDGHGVWADHDHQVGFFLELDRGTEPLGRLVGKLPAHRRLLAEGGPAYPVLFALPSRTREQNLHRRLAERPEPGPVVATTSPESGSDPAAAVWRVAGNGRHRLRLAELPANPGQPGPLNPLPPAPGEHPLHHLR